MIHYDSESPDQNNKDDKVERHPIFLFNEKKNPFLYTLRSEQDTHIIPKDKKN